MTQEGMLVRFITLTGPIATVKTQEFPDASLAFQAVKEYAESAGFSNVRTVEDPDGYGLRYTATTPKGRHGRNIAFVDF